MIELPPDIDFDGPLYEKDGVPVMNRTIVISDNLPALRAMPSDSVDLIYLDPPFNSGADYLNPIGLSAKEAGGLLEDVSRPVPGANEPYQTGFSDVFHMEELNPDGSQNDNWKPGWVQEISLVIPSIPGLVELAGASHSPSMQGYVTFMAIRLIEMQRILKPGGSIYLHCDDTSVHYLKLLMDTVFGRDRYLNNIIWKRAVAHNDSKKLGRIVDHILYYANGDDWTWNDEGALRPKTQDEIANAYPDMDNVGRYRGADLTGAGAQGGESILPWTGYDVAARGRHWAPPLRDGTYADYIEAHFISNYKFIKGVHARLDALDEAGLITHPKTGVWPGLKRYADADRGNMQQNLVLSPIGFTNYSTKKGEYVGYKTQKPLGLLERLIRMSSNPGDVVLDPFCRCATTPIAAENLKRRWIGMDRGVEAYRQVVNRIRKKFPDMTTEGEFALIENRRFYRVDELPGQDNDAQFVVEATQQETPPPRLNLDRDQKRALLGLQEGYCLGCANKPDIDLMEGDHVVPRIQSGPEEMVNLQLLCAHSNRVKGGNRSMRDLWTINERKGVLIYRLRMENLFRERDPERLANERMMALRDKWW